MDAELRELERRAASGDAAAREALLRARDRSGVPSIAVIASVQGNLEALEVVLADIDRQGVSDVICLGSLLRWGPDPIACLDRVRARCRVVLRGWDEHLLLGDPGTLGLRAQRWREWFLAELRPAGWLRRWRQESDERLRFLAALPGRHDEAGWTFAYADPRSGPEQDWSALHQAVPLLESPVVGGILASIPSVLVAVGSSHRPSLWREGDAELLTPERWERPEGGPKAVVWVGSVGQPRDRDRRAAYSVIDGETVH